MELAKVTSEGQITLPVALRRALGVKEGDKVMLIRQEGKAAMMNASLTALLEARQALAGAAAEPGLKGAEAVAAMVKEIRAERRSRYKRV